MGKLLTVREAADLLAVSPRTIMRWKAERGLPYIRLTARSIRFDPRALDEWAKGKTA